MDRAEYVAGQKREYEWVRTHESAQDAIRSAVPGARVEFVPSRNGELNGMHYTIHVDRARRIAPDGTATDMVLTGAYMLPAPVEALRKDAQTTVDNALRAVSAR
jgi:hypothetical protein